MNRRDIREQTLEGSISMRDVHLITWGGWENKEDNNRETLRALK